LYLKLLFFHLWPEMYIRKVFVFEKHFQIKNRCCISICICIVFWKSICIVKHAYSYHVQFWKLYFSHVKKWSFSKKKSLTLIRLWADFFGKDASYRTEKGIALEFTCFFFKHISVCIYICNQKSSNIHLWFRLKILLRCQNGFGKRRLW
jgi:hypothetical protein